MVRGLQSPRGAIYDDILPYCDLKLSVCVFSLTHCPSCSDFLSSSPWSICSLIWDRQLPSRLFWKDEPNCNRLSNLGAKVINVQRQFLLFHSLFPSYSRRPGPLFSCLLSFDAIPQDDIDLQRQWIIVAICAILLNWTEEDGRRSRPISWSLILD